MRGPFPIEARTLVISRDQAPRVIHPKHIDPPFTGGIEIGHGPRQVNRRGAIRAPVIDPLPDAAIVSARPEARRDAIRRCESSRPPADRAKTLGKKRIGARWISISTD